MVFTVENSLGCKRIRRAKSPVLFVISGFRFVKFSNCFIHDKSRHRL